MKRAPSAARGCVRRSTARVSASRAQREALLVCRAMAIRGRGGARNVEERAVAGGRRSGSRAATFAPRALCTGERAVHANCIILFATPRVLCGPFPLTTFGLLTPCQKTVKKPNVSMCNVTWGSQIVFRGNSPSFAPVPANGQPRKCPHRRGRNRGLGENEKRRNAFPSAHHGACPSIGKGRSFAPSPPPWSGARRTCCWSSPCSSCRARS